MFCQFLNCFLTVREFGLKPCNDSCKNARNLTHGGWCASAFKYGGSVTCWYLFGQCLLQGGQSRVGVAGVGLKALDSFPQTSQLFVLILQLLQQILDLQRERRDRELSEASTVRVKTRSMTAQEGKCSRPGLILQHWVSVSAANLAPPNQRWNRSSYCVQRLFIRSIRS